jgi:hypothetical protein
MDPRLLAACGEGLEKRPFLVAGRATAAVG